MDKIHDPEGRAWISEPVVVGDYFREFSERVEREKPLIDMSGNAVFWLIDVDSNVVSLFDDSF